MAMAMAMATANGGVAEMEDEELLDYGDGETASFQDSDVDMIDAAAATELGLGAHLFSDASAEVEVDHGDSLGAPGCVGGETEQTSDKTRKKKKKKKKKNNNKDNKGGCPKEPTTAFGIHRFVAETSKHLNEPKRHLILNAVDCLGVSAVRYLVAEVDAIQKCGGQQTVNGARLRTGGGVLWNILKTREPKAYKEIMAKGREQLKQFRRTGQWVVKNEVTSSQGTLCPEEEEEEERKDGPRQLANPSTQVQATERRKKPVHERIRVPIAYDDLLEEGEIPD